MAHGSNPDHSREKDAAGLSMLVLRPYQSEGIQAIYAAYERGVRRQLLAAATGAGKTVLFASLVSQRPGRALILAHRDRLIQQAAEKLSTVIPWHRMGIVKAEQNQCRSDVVVASVQTLSRSRRLGMLPKFDTVIIDEAHRSAAKTYKGIIDHVCHDDTLLLGVTATPSRADGIGLDKVYQEIVYQIGLLDLIEQGYLAPLRGQKIYIAADFSALHTKTNTDGISDYKQDEVVELMTKANWFEKVTEGWLKYAPDRRTIAFVPPGKDANGRSTAMAFQLAEHMRSQGISAIAINGESELSEQRRAIREFEQGRIQVIVNCDIFTEGLDIPSIDCVLFARPTKSQIVYSQSIGRGSRLSPETGKTDCLVLDMVGATNRFDLCTLGDLFGLRSLKGGEEVRAALKREKGEDEQAAAEQLSLPDMAEGEVRAKDVNLFGGREPKKPLFEWEINAEAKRSKLHVAGHTFEIWREGGTSWYSFGDMHWKGTLSGRTTDYREARARIEEEAKRILFGDQNAPWRQKPASEKQVSLLLKFKIPFEANITKGQASDLLDARLSKKGKREVVTV
jgi:superfamily II DNA or RNA helicase